MLLVVVLMTGKATGTRCLGRRPLLQHLPTWARSVAVSTVPTSTTILCCTPHRFSPVFCTFCTQTCTPLVEVSVMILVACFAAATHLNLSLCTCHCMPVAVIYMHQYCTGGWSAKSCDNHCCHMCCDPNPPTHICAQPSILTCAPLCLSSSTTAGCLLGPGL